MHTAGNSMIYIVCILIDGTIYSSAICCMTIWLYGCI